MQMKYAVLPLVLMATACAEGQMPQGVQDNKNAIIGTGAGAAVGSVLGRIISPGSDQDKYQQVGAVLGAGLGAVLGNQLDVQEKALRQQMRGSGAQIHNTGSALNVVLPEAITFAVDSSALKPQFVAHLQQLAANLRQYPNSQVQVVGHTDDTGGVAHNQRLSEARARSVAAVLTGNGVSPGRIVTRGEGEFAPIATNATAAGRQANRRVVVTITPTG